MEQDASYKKFAGIIVMVLLVVLAFFLIKPLILSIIAGVLLAFLCSPIYNFLLKRVKSQNLAAGIVCALLILLIVIPLWFLVPKIIDQTFQIYLAAQKLDFGGILQQMFPSLFQSPEFSAQVSAMTSSFVSKTMNSIINGFSDLFLNLATVLLQILIVSFTFFFVLRDKEDIMDYVKSLLPFSKDVEKRLFESSKEITYSVLYGYVAVGLLQGLIVGVGLLIFGIPNALFLTLLACLAAVIPVLGTPFIWIPVVIFLFISGDKGAMWGMIGFGLFSSTIDNFLRPLIISKRAKLNILLTTIGMVGGLFMFGFLGIVIGPLILAYLVIVFDIYRDRRTFNVLIQPSEEKK